MSSSLLGAQYILPPAAPQGSASPCTMSAAPSPHPWLTLQPSANSLPGSGYEPRALARDRPVPAQQTHCATPICQDPTGLLAQVSLWST